MRNRTVVIVGSVVAAATTGVIIACRDVAQPTSSPATVGPPSSFAPQRHVDSQVAGIAQADVRTRLHRRNSRDAVGVAHNLAIERFRAQLRKPGVISRHMCRYLVDFLAAGNDPPPSAVHGVSLAERRRLVEAGAAASAKLCRNDRRGRPFTAGADGSSPRFVAAASAVLEPTQQLADQIEAAIGAATDSYDLARRLDPILDAATGLDADGRLVIEATVSVAQSSFEYWEQSWTGFVQEVGGEYRDCIASLKGGKGAGPEVVSPEQEAEYCLNGTVSTARSVQPQSNRLFRSTLGTRKCGTPLAQGFKNVAKSDARGAFIGAFAGLLSAGPAAAISGAILGGAGGSLFESIVNAVDAYVCYWSNA